MALVPDVVAGLSWIGEDAVDPPMQMLRTLPHVGPIPLRDTHEAAWAHAQGWLDGLDPTAVEKAQAALAQSESTGQQRVSALRAGRHDAPRDARDLEVEPGLWAGIGLVRGGAGTALVGSHDEVAERLEDYHALGIDEFLLSGYPHVEEAYWFAEGVMPRLRRRGVLDREPAGLAAVG